MAAYMIVIVHIKERARFLEDYAKPTAALIAQFGGRYIVRAPNAVALEGAFGAGASVVVSEWPDRAAIEAFYTSPAYQALKAARAPLADATILVVEQPG